MANFCICDVLGLGFSTQRCKSIKGTCVEGLWKFFFNTLCKAVTSSSFLFLFHFSLHLPCTIPYMALGH